MLWYIYYNQRLWVISSIAWNVFTIRLLYFPQVTTFDLFLVINSEQFTSGRGWLQNFFTRFIKSCGLAVRTLNITKLRTSRIRKLQTCGCGLRKLKFGCGFADCGLKKKLGVPSTVKNNLPVYLMIPCNYCINPEPVAQIMKYMVSRARHAVASYYTCMKLPYVLYLCRLHVCLIVEWILLLNVGYSVIGNLCSLVFVLYYIGLPDLR